MYIYADKTPETSEESQHYFKILTKLAYILNHVTKGICDIRALFLLIAQKDPIVHITASMLESIQTFAETDAMAVRFVEIINSKLSKGYSGIYASELVNHVYIEPVIYELIPGTYDHIKLPETQNYGKSKHRFIITAEQRNQALLTSNGWIPVNYLGTQLQLHVSWLVRDSVNRADSIGIYYYIGGSTLVMTPLLLTHISCKLRSVQQRIDTRNDTAIDTQTVLCFPIQNGNAIGIFAYAITKFSNILLEVPVPVGNEPNTVPVIDTHKTVYLLDHLKQQIRVRYAFCDRPRSGYSNEIIDSFFPKLMYVNNFNTATIDRNHIPATAVAISGLVSDLLNVKQIPINELIKVLGYTEDRIKKLLRQVKAKNLTMVFAGAGGTGMNTAFWLSELCDLTNTVRLFKQVFVYEEENMELSNMFRFPMGLRHYNRPLPPLPTTKLAVISQFIDRLTTNKPVYNNRFIRSGNLYASTDPWIEQTETGIRVKDGCFVYGAPNLQHRNELSALGNFISATHADISCAIWINPHQDADIQVESYGMIQLGSFFMNQLRLTIGLLELLASDTDIRQADTQFLNYSFDGLTVLPTTRQYQWQIINNMDMATEETAAAPIL